MKSLLQKSLFGTFLLALLIVPTTSVKSQTTIFSENMGTPAATTAISANTFQNSATLTYSGTADVRITTISAGYAGASGGGNVFFTTTIGREFVISGINTTGYTGLTLSFGHFKSSTTANNELVVEVGTNGITYTPLTYSRAIGTGTATYALITASGTIPSVSNLYLRFRQTTTAASFRLDDVKLIGTIAAPAPTVVTTAATAITNTAATLNGTINANNTTSDVSFQYGTTISYGTTVAGTPSPLTGTTVSAVSASISSLTVNTLYNFRAVGSVSGVPTNGSNMTFHTLAATPGVVTVSNPSTTSLSVTVDGTTSNGNPASTQFAIQETGSGLYVQANGSLGVTAVWQTAATWATIIVTPLNDNTQYTFAVKARNGANVETGFGATASGTTLVNLVAAVTITSALPAFGSVCINSALTQSFTFNAANLDGSALTVNALAGFSYSLTVNGTYNLTLPISYSGNSITGLQVFVKFNPTAVQSYNGGIQITGGGLASAFVVAATGAGINTAATTATGAASAITSTSANASATVTIGCSSISAYGVEYSTVNGFTAGSGITVAGGVLSGGSFTASLSGLTPNTVYYYSSFVTDGTGTAVGSQISFTTLNVTAPVATAATNILQDQFTANWNAVAEPGATYLLDVSTSSTFGITTPTSNLFISEYGEGSGGNKKYIEIYNGTGAAVNLANYQLWKNVNGSNWNFLSDNITPTLPLSLTGILANGATYVIANNATDVIGANLYSTFLSFNGNDATGLASNGGGAGSFALIDVVGSTINPGTGWAVAGTVNATVDRILIRKATIFSPNLNWTASAGTNVATSEWIVSSFVYNATSQTTNLGSHTINNITPSFVSGYNNLSVSGTSALVTGLTESTNYYYRVRAVTANSTSANSNVISVMTAATPPIFGAISQVVEFNCEGSVATFNVTGLLPDSTSTLSFNINGGDTQTVTGVTANASGFATFELVLQLNNNGQTLTVTSVTRTDLSSGSVTPTSANTVILSVYQNITYHADSDGDGFGDAANTTQSCSGMPTGYVIDATDCDDADPGIHETFSFYTDGDGDTFGAGNLVPVCASAANMPPTGYSLNNTDCDDANGTVFQSGTLFVDADGDGYTTGISVILCYGTVPAGYTNANIGIDCNDQIAAINPGQTEALYNGVDDNCNGLLDEGFQITTQIQASQCGTTLTAINSLISAVSTPQVNGYRFEVTNTSTNVVQTIETGLQFFSLTQLASYDYATTYSIRVMVRRNGVWLGYYGASCLVSSPAILAPGGAAQVSPSQCGITLASINTLISTTSLAGVSGYRFRITNTDDTAPNQVQIIDRPLQWFSLPMLSTYNYGTTYLIEVAVKTNGVYSGFGSPCSITTPAVPSITSCGTIIPTATTLIYTTSLSKVSSYRFEITNLQTNVVTTIDRPLHWFSFSNIPGYSLATQYGVRVSVMTSGVYSPFSDACAITSPGTARPEGPKTEVSKETFAVVAYPNPFAQNFNIDVRSASDALINVKVYDMTGRLLETRTVATADVESQQLGANYPSGVYNVIIQQANDIKTMRVIKR